MNTLISIFVIQRFLRTISKLKFKQIYFLFYYKIFRLRRRSYLSIRNLLKEPKTVNVQFINSRHIYNQEHNSFTFLNRTKSFDNKEIEWSYSRNGLLWEFNMNYLECLLQEEMSKELGVVLVKKFYNNINQNHTALHPYTTSLRIVSVVKFCVKFSHNEDRFSSELHADLNSLTDRLEYHLMGNHLLENAFALYIGGLYLDCNKNLEKGKVLLKEQLSEQILEDGMHFERSPMYHLILLERLLDALNMAQSWEDDLQSILINHAINMTSCARNWENLNCIPMMQDSAHGIAKGLNDLLVYAQLVLNEKYPDKPSNLGISGYRLLENRNITIFANVGSINPSYQPGHSHADELNFELFYKGSPIIVDSGVSTYEKDAIRERERSTRSHNCLTINNKNSSEVWSGFRVGKRAKVHIKSETPCLKALHDGYNPVIVGRSWILKEYGVDIIDQISCSKKLCGVHCEGVGRLHIHPSVDVTIIGENLLRLGKNITLSFIYNGEIEPIRIEGFEFANGFNSRMVSKVILYSVKNTVKIVVCEVS